jgi:hypothetical protein
MICPLKGKKCKNIIESEGQRTNESSIKYNEDKNSSCKKIIK